MCETFDYTDSTSTSFAIDNSSPTADGFADGSFINIIRYLVVFNEDYKLKRPYIISIINNENGFILTNEELNVHVFGTDLVEALKEFETVHIELYNSYINEDIENLTEDAIELRKNLDESLEKLS